MEQIIALLIGIAIGYFFVGPKIRPWIEKRFDIGQYR